MIGTELKVLSDGILRSARYAFGPNRLHYCGPDAHREIFGYMAEGAADPGLEILLKGFRTMYPYLSLIARANNIKDPFDERVIEAYWIGNELLEGVEKQRFYRHLLEDIELKKKVGISGFNRVAEKIGAGAVPHHSFHVLDIWKRTGYLEREHTLESMDACRVSWGKVLEVSGPFVKVETEPLLYRAGKLVLSEAEERKITRSLETDIDVENLKPDDIVSMHWGVICEVITPKQAAVLKKYTLRHIALANQTI